ncbi:hypothetical protein [Aliiglaciecola sp. M165]|uniref:hypothetical protein n=1 Tax=Aliiglaciecola sp. M165 TaxID=2593649 RepID=UPI00117E6B72|nr:hypothetical protein [Aliiglaciecola sp. M165]TRY30927.1 hypothetical protein FM019_13690 [Aliiglaciecola sp. M165]
MKKLSLNHEFTPPPLADINLQIQTTLEAEELDDSLLKTLIEERDSIITKHLEDLKDGDVKSFAKTELVINQKLSEHINKQLKASLKQLSGLLRGRKAVNKYK